MSLYDECEAVIKRPKPRNPGINFLESHLRTKKPTPNKLQKVTLAPVIDLHRRNKKPEPKRKIATKRWVIQDEYDPLHPNDFFKIRTDVQLWREKEQQRKMQEEAVAAAIRIEIVKSREQELKEQQLAGTKKNFLSNYGYDSDDGSGDEQIQFQSNGRKGVEFAPPSCLTNPTPVQKGEAAAAKIMAKYGFKEGQGLGKDQQGISTALQVQRTSRNYGRIVHEQELMPPPTTPRLNQKDLTSEPQQPSKVVLLCNMVGMGEVDDELENEIKDECSMKYGEVNRVGICQDGSGEVRVFVEFKQLEVAVKAVLDLNGRYFGGRTVKAQFYDDERYMLELNDKIK